MSHGQVANHRRGQLLEIADQDKMVELMSHYRYNGGQLRGLSSFVDNQSVEFLSRRENRNIKVWGLVSSHDSKYQSRNYLSHGCLTKLGYGCMLSSPEADPLQVETTISALSKTFRLYAFISPLRSLPF